MSDSSFISQCLLLLRIIGKLLVEQVLIVFKCFLGCYFYQLFSIICPSIFILGRDGLPAWCYLFHSRMDMLKTKRLIEWKVSADAAIVKKNLVELAELNRVLSSKKLCRRQSVLSLMDEPSPQSCLSSESQCDTCLGISVPIFKNVTKEVRLVLNFLDHHSDLDVFTLRNVLAGLNHNLSRDHVHAVEGLLFSWALDEIAQFTDFLTNEKFMHKQGTLVNDVPSYRLIPNHANINGDEIFMSLHEVVPIVRSDKKQTTRTRHHDIRKRRFFPKGMTRS